MKLTAMDIRQYEFRRSFTGYEPAQVKSLLEMIADEMESLVRENSTLKTELRRKENQLKAMEESERNVREVLMTLHKITQQVRGDAEREAQVIVSRAQLQADTILGDAQKKYSDIAAEVQEIRRVKIQLVGAVRSAVDQHMRLLDAFSVEDPKGSEDKIRFFTPSSGSTGD